MNKKQLEQSFLHFLGELDILLNNGFDILSAIELYQKSCPDRQMQSILETALDKIHSGNSISQSLFETGFTQLPRFYRTVFLSAEKSGTFSLAISQLRSFMEKKEAFESHLKKIMIYPIITIGTALGALFVTLFYFLPSLSLIYKDMDADLPAFTQTIIIFSEKTSSHFLPLLAGLCLFLFVGFVFSAPLKNILKKWKPVSFLFQWFQCYFISFHFSMLLDAGLDFIQAVEIMSETAVHGPIFQNIFHETKSGIPVIESFRKHWQLPSVFYETISIGLQSGKLGQSFHYLFDSSRKKLEYHIAYISAFLEPLLILLTAAIVGLIVLIGLYPLLTMSDMAMGL